MLTCNVAKDLLPNYVDGLVSEETAAELAEHLLDCDSCRSEYERMKTLLAPVVIQGEKDIDYLKKINTKNKLRVIKYSIISVIAISIIFAVSVKIFCVGAPVKSGDLLYTAYMPDANSARVEMRLQNGYALLVKRNYKENNEFLLAPRQVREMPFDNVGNEFSWGSEYADGEFPDDFRVVLRFSDKDTVLTIDDFVE